jgi:hypothetical protein
MMQKSRLQLKSPQAMWMDNSVQVVRTSAGNELGRTTTPLRCQIKIMSHMKRGTNATRLVSHENWKLAQKRFLKAAKH